MLHCHLNPHGLLELHLVQILQLCGGFGDLRIRNEGLSGSLIEVTIIVFVFTVLLVFLIVVTEADVIFSFQLLSVTIELVLLREKFLAVTHQHLRRKTLGIELLGVELEIFLGNCDSWL